jgi:hypothetical protein
MWEPRRLTTLWVSTACYRNSCLPFTIYQSNLVILLKSDISRKNSHLVTHRPACYRVRHREPADECLSARQLGPATMTVVTLGGEDFVIVWQQYHLINRGSHYGVCLQCTEQQEIRACFRDGSSDTMTRRDSFCLSFWSVVSYRRRTDCKCFRTQCPGECWAIHEQFPDL